MGGGGAREARGQSGALGHTFRCGQRVPPAAAALEDSARLGGGWGVVSLGPTHHQSAAAERRRGRVAAGEEATVG